MERKFNPELAFAPNTTEGVLQEIGSIACDGQCNLQACMQDRHHLLFGEDLSPAEQLLKSHPDFILPGVCGAVHIEFHHRHRRSEPLSDGFVIDYMLENPVNMSKTRQKKLNKLRGVR